jgi:hypothetical protein
MSSDVLTIEYCVIRYRTQYVHIVDWLESEQKLRGVHSGSFRKEKVFNSSRRSDHTYRILFVLRLCHKYYYKHFSYSEPRNY